MDEIQREEQETAAEDETAEERNIGFTSIRHEALDTPRWNSAPHPELWPSPDTNPDAEPREGDEDAVLRVVPEAPNVNMEFVMKGSGLPINTGVVWRLDGADHTGAPTFFTHKTDPFGDCHVVWRVPRAGDMKVTIMGKRDHSLEESELASATVTILDPANDRRLGEARGRG